MSSHNAMSCTPAPAPAPSDSSASNGVWTGTAASVSYAVLGAALLAAVAVLAYRRFAKGSNEEKELILETTKNDLLAASNDPESNETDFQCTVVLPPK